MGLNLAVAAGAMAIVNTGAIVRGDLGPSDAAVAVAMGAFGTGPTIAAILPTKLLYHWTDRPVMLGTAIASIGGLTIFAGAAAISGLSRSGLSVAYPLVGVAMTWFGASIAAAMLAVLGSLGLAIALWVWPAEEPEILSRAHPDPPPDRPRLRGIRPPFPCFCD